MHINLFYFLIFILRHACEFVLSESFVDVTMVLFSSVSVELGGYQGMPSEATKEIIPAINCLVTEIEAWGTCMAQVNFFDVSLHSSNFALNNCILDDGILYEN